MSSEWLWLPLIKITTLAASLMAFAVVGARKPRRRSTGRIGRTPRGVLTAAGGCADVASALHKRRAVPAATEDSEDEEWQAWLLKISPDEYTTVGR
jgi:hypothetical protein